MEKSTRKLGCILITVGQQIPNFKYNQTPLYGHLLNTDTSLLQTICYMWVEFVVGSLPCSERFISGYSSFLLSSKTNISKFQFDQESGRRRTTMWMCYLQIVIYLFTYLVYSPHQYRHFPWPPQRFSS